MDGRSSIGGSWEPLITALLTKRGPVSPHRSAPRRRDTGVLAGRSVTERGDAVVGMFEEARFAEASSFGTRTAPRSGGMTLIGRIAAALSTTTP
jgi:hypothetical protein